MSLNDSTKYARLPRMSNNLKRIRKMNLFMLGLCASMLVGNL